MLNAAVLLFHRYLLSRQASSLAVVSQVPFLFEDRTVDAPQKMRELWETYVQDERVGNLKVEAIEVLSPEEMVAKYGTPPAKLAAWPLKGNMISVGNLSGHAVVTVWKKIGERWHAVAFHD